MRLIGADGKNYNFDVKQSKNPIRSFDKKKSSLQWDVGQQLKKLFPRNVILEEFVIPGSALRIDFFIPELSLAIEANGEQHYKYVSFFHGSKSKFREACARDEAKHSWCSINGITFVVIKSPENTYERISEALS